MRLQDLPPAQTEPGKVGDASKLLLLENVVRLRQLQTKINEILVLLQQVTANPTIDLSLGSVGR